MSTSPQPTPMHASAPTFHETFERELPFVCRALRRLGVHEADLADVAQDLFMTVHARFADYDVARPVRTWLYAFCLRYAANYRRLARHRLDAERDPAVTQADDTAARDLVLRALDRLDEDRRATLVLHDLEGFSAPEIAELTSVGLNTVYSRIRLARRDFRAAVTSLSSGGAP